MNLQIDAKRFFFQGGGRFNVTFNGHKHFVLLSVIYNVELHRAPQRWRAPLASEYREGEPAGKTPK